MTDAMAIAAIAGFMLSALPYSPALAWEIERGKDRMTDKDYTIASVTDNGFPLVVGCVNGRLDATIWLAKSTVRFSGPVGVTFRFDDGPVIPRMAYVSETTGYLYLWQANPAEGLRMIKKSKRLRVDIKGAFADFDLTKGDPLPEIRC